jgi:Arc/MetJ family transcription regulator
MEKRSVIQCDDDLYAEVVAHLQCELVGKAIYYADSLRDLVDRNIPELYELCEEHGYKFIPSDDKEELMQTPPDFWFDIIKIGAAN